MDFADFHGLTGFLGWKRLFSVNQKRCTPKKWGKSEQKFTKTNKNEPRSE